MFIHRMFALSWLPAILAVMGTGIFLANPEQVFQAATEGVEIWWKVVFPALMPYFMLTELLLASGLIHFCGRLATPVTGPLLGLPGAAIWALLSGWIGGYPAGAKATASLAQQGIIHKQQGERLLAYSHTASPALVATVIAAGFLHMPQLALPLLLIHWAAQLIVILLVAWSVRSPTAQLPKQAASIWKQALRDMRRARQADGRSFGQLLGDTVKHVIEQLFAIGGIIIFCSVAAVMLHPILNLLHLQAWGAWAVVVLEVHLGASQLAQWQLPELTIMMAAIGALLGFSGLSMLLQVRALLSKSGIRLHLFLMTRLMHAVLAFGLTLAIWEPLLHLLHRAVVPTITYEFPLIEQSSYGVAPLYVWALAAPAITILLFVFFVACSTLLIIMKKAGQRMTHWFRLF